MKRSTGYAVDSPERYAMLAPGAIIRDLTIGDRLGQSSRFEFFAAQSDTGPRLVARVIGSVLDDAALESRVAQWADRSDAAACGLPTALYRATNDTLLVAELTVGDSWSVATSQSSPESGLPWLGRLVDAVARLHAVRTFHGDLSPETVRVGPDGRVALLMPGVADLIGATGVLGPWSEPEISCGATPSTSSDVFSLAVAATALGGAPCGPDSRRARRAIARGRRPAPKFVPAHAAWPSEIVDAINTALSGRELRPSNALVLRVVLRSQSARPKRTTPLQIGIASAASAVSPPPRRSLRRRLASRWPSIRRGVLATAVVVLFVLVGRWTLNRPYNPRCSSQDDCAAGLHCEASRCQAAGMVYLPPARFEGGALDSPAYDRDEPYRARLTYGLYVDRAEVTQSEFQRLTNARPSWFSQCGDECPVESVNWFEAIEYANLRSEEAGLPSCYRASGCTGEFGSGCPELEIGDPAHNCVGEYSCTQVEFAGLECRGYRLPTEVEWEYAARGGTREMTYAGTLEFSGPRTAESVERIGRIARTAESSEVSYPAWPCSAIEGINPNDQCGPGVVRSLEPNAFGLYDTLGNVGEWTTDRAEERVAHLSGWRCFGRGAVQSNGEKSCDANLVTDRLVHEDSASPRVLRGGAFFHSAPGARVSIRNALRWDRRFIDVGFRLVRTALPPQR